MCTVEGKPSRVVLGLSLILAALAACAPARDDTLVFRFATAGWLGHKHLREGRFEACSISKRYPTSTLVTIGLSHAFRLELVLRNDRWRLGDGRASPVEVAVDGRPIGDVATASSRETELVLDLGVAWETFEALQRGAVLTVGAFGTQLRFPLDESGAAMAGLLECVHRANEAPG
ncbi:MAG: hypothetical protein ACE5Q3_10800 [Alphaproteobacteria bacterium]